jgi:hypothetical protein
VRSEEVIYTKNLTGAFAVNVPKTAGTLCEIAAKKVKM